ncbi:MAG: ABC transporter substrate-binding protein [Atopobiaceae bacterium]|jgi:peptide/nickel transport system substrate-binding protein/oligopeptide transport system substrate-binding protein|nr:ABC transporter substrate-binding protein [Atopobiaceae bacterium]MCH4180757.1 ABC transporter substrate-binding protein [Atopobiaceae bacterium]MCH4214478.1 ABC transporter substrate-binding protein [Atopobiaceae bacterium]MCH4229408.1 ABC transporter substrate-binding protein [Atopobiaceae bacterium]MCH4276634.1 ABC transporter substrate-binding protein [Atopobiaceae bacterium]
MADFKQPVMGRRTFVKGGIAASALVALAGCGKKGGDTTTASTTSTSGGTLNYYLNNPECIDPFNCQEDQGTQVCYQLFDSLVSYDFSKSQLVPLAATSWEASDDATKFTFHLAEGAKFSNGDAVDAKAFKRGWERIVNPNTLTTGDDTASASPSVISYHLAMVQGYDELQAGNATEMPGLTCPDDNTFVVQLTAPYADFPYVCSHPALVPVPQAAIDDHKTFYYAPIGNGPFKMSGKWEDGQYIDIVKNDDYYGDSKATIDGVHFNIQKDAETAYKEFQAGNIDVAEVPTSMIDDALKTYGQSDDGFTITPGKQILLGDELSTYYIAVNVKDPVMADVNLRRAISLAINRQAICDTLFSGTRNPADNIVPPGIKGYEEGAWAYSKYDKDAAVALLDQYYPAGSDGKRNLSLTLSYNLDGSHKQIMESVISDLNAVGIDVASTTKEWAAILDDYDAGDFQMGRLGWIADYPIMDNFLYPLFYTGNGDNRSQYSNADVDAAITEARTTTDDDQRISKLQAVNKTIAEDMPVIPLMFYKHQVCGSSKIQSLYVDPQKKADMSQCELSS